AWSSLKHFHPGDTVWVSFSTFRCGVENDTALLNLPKAFNQWRLYVNGITVCGDQASIIHSTPIGSSTTNGKYNLDLKLQFIPSITDLSVPAGATFGDSARFEIESKSIVTSVADFQLFGAVNTSKTSGWIRATIHCERGLVVQNRESEVYFQYFDVDSNKNIIIEPKFYHASIPLNFCDTGNYFFYFDLEDTLMLKAINGGEFIFNLQACCNINSNPAATDFEVKFHLIPNPDSCFNLTYNDTAHILPPNCTGISCDDWIPLSSSASRIFTHCPGCLAPGIIVQDYKMKRISFGLQDSNNDGLADNSLTQIMNPSPWFTSHENDLIQHFSSYGDQLEDKMTAYFQDGDSSAGGYNYVQLRNIGLTLPFLQLSRIIPAGLDTMKAFPLEFTFYIDSIMSPSNCIDCDGFSLDTSITRTLYKLNISGANLNQYLDVIQNENRLLFTFDGSIDSLNQLIGNLGSNSPYLDSTYSFNGFYEGQRYRLKVRYANCGNFIGENIDNTTLASVMIKSEITNKMWLCGAKQDHNKPQMYNTVDELRDSLNMTVYPNDPIYQLMDTSYINNYLFFCETFGGVHYFFTQEARNYSVLDTAVGCDKHLTVVAHTETAGYPYIINIYPFEYRPPMLWPKSYEINVPSGYYISQSLMSHGFRFINDPFLKYTNWVAFDLIDSVGNFTIYDSTLSPPICISDTLFPIALSDTNMYVKSALTLRFLQFTLSPLGCDSNSNYLISNDSMVIIKFGNQNISCLDSNSCSITEITRRSNLEDDLFTLLPNLVVQASPPTINVTGNQVCVTLNLSNILKEISDGVNSTTASNVFLALPDTVSVPFLHNWVYYSPDTINPSGQIIQIDTLFDVNLLDTGILCASFRNCGNNLSDTSYFTFYTGWNCGGFPISPFDADSVCGATAQTITLIRSSAFLSNSGKSPSQYIAYSLCDTIVVDADFVSTGGGYLYPTFVNLDSIPRGMGVLSVYLINNETDTDSVFLTYNSTTQNYPIDTAQMSSLNFPNHAFYSGQSIKVKALLIPTCEYTSDSLPQIEFYALDYCDSVHESPATFQGSIDIVGSNCQDCFDVKKIASQSYIQAGDTMKFNIIICANNADSGFVYVDEILPANFNLIGSIPWFFVTPPIGCDTVVVNGYFSTPGSCDDNFNTVRIRYSGFDSLNVYFGPDTLIDSACVTVGVACVDPNTIIFLNNDSSHNYLNTFSNASIYVEGLFTVDVDLELINCKVFMAAGAQIIISSSISLNIDDSTQIMGCDSMWQGILMEPGATIQVLNGSKINDANRAIQIDDECEVYLRNAEFYNNITGVYSAPNFGNVYNLGAFSVTGTTFSFSGSFLPNYTGQPSHGVSPFAGIDLTDVVVSIGESGSDPNHFLNMNFGIKGFRSSMEVANCEFQNIYSVSGYSTKLMGTAIVSVGDVILGLPGNLSVLPISSNSNTILKCERGVYASYSDLVVSNCKISDVNTGVECTGNILMRRAMVIENIITARKYGIRFYENAGAMSMSAFFNSITISGSTTNVSTIGTAISVMEKSNSPGTSYDISYNAPITLIDANAGIELLSIYKPKVGCNNVLQKIGAGQAVSTVGISLNSCVGAQVTQNLVKGYSTTNTSRIGVNTDQSINSLISCNSVDSTGFGFHFTSSNLNTNFRGNIMRSHFEGLHLTNTAVIDTQTFAGNRWYGNYGPWFGAVNLNLGFFNLRQSLFIVNPTDSTFSPGIPANNTFWFQTQLGTSNYTCSNINPCSSVQIIYDGGDVNLMELIALDSSLTLGYIDESRDISQSILFDFLMTDSALRNSSSTFTTFINSNPVLQSLYEVKLQYHDLINVEDSTAILLLALDASIKVMIDTLKYFNQAVLDNPSLDFSTEINQANISLNIMKAAYSTLVQQFRIRENAILVNAEFYNSQVNAIGLPLENEEAINGVQIMYDLYGKDSIESLFQSFLYIAQLCPSQGGSAVYRARFFVSLFNDSLTYNDFNVCLAQGYYREMAGTLSDASIEPTIIVKPNPANEQVEIMIENNKEKDYILRITDLEGRIKYHFNKTASELKTIINTSELNPGIYFVLVDDSSGLQLSKKLIIVR
ncbi:MAG: T9SS type A sorting domain-containing protein, partial [Bacteroidia bacterium]